MQEKKQSYFISLDKMTVTEISVPDTVEYEVIASPTEMLTLRSILERISVDEFMGSVGELFFSPFAEQKADHIRHEYDQDLYDIYQFLYEHGTDETKQKLQEVKPIL